MLKTGLSALLLVAATAAAAQPATTPPANQAPAQQQRPAPPPAFIAAAEEFGRCGEGGVEQTPATVTPEATAAQAIAACSTQKAALETEFEAWVAGPDFPEANRDMARQQFRSQIGTAEAQLAEQIRQQRSGAQPSE